MLRPTWTVKHLVDVGALRDTRTDAGPLGPVVVPWHPVEDGWVPPASTARGRLTDPDVLACDLGARSRATEVSIDLTRLRPREPEREPVQR